MSAAKQVIYAGSSSCASRKKASARDFILNQEGNHETLRATRYKRSFAPRIEEQKAVELSNSIVPEQKQWTAG
jgi:hypothetical protein